MKQSERSTEKHPGATAQARKRRAVVNAVNRNSDDGVAFLLSFARSSNEASSVRELAIDHRRRDGDDAIQVREHEIDPIPRNLVQRSFPAINNQDLVTEPQQRRRHLTAEPAEADHHDVLVRGRRLRLLFVSQRGVAPPGTGTAVDGC